MAIALEGMTQPLVWLCALESDEPGPPSTVTLSMTRPESFSLCRWVHFRPRLFTYVLYPGHRRGVPSGCRLLIHSSIHPPTQPSVHSSSSISSPLSFHSYANMSFYSFIHSSICQDFFYLSTHPSISLASQSTLSISISIHPSIHASIHHSFIYLLIFISIHPSIHPSIFSSTHLSNYFLVHLSIHLSTQPSIHPFSLVIAHCASIYTEPTMC